MNEPLLSQEKPDSNILVQLLQKYLPFWPLFIVTIPVAMGIAFLILRSQVPIYVSNAKVLLKDPNKGSGDSKVLDALNIFSEKKIVDNEILVLKSASIVQKVVKSLHLYCTVYNEGKIKLEELYGQNSPFTLETQLEDSIAGNHKYFFTINWQSRQINIDHQLVSFDSMVVLDNIPYRILINNRYNKNLIGKKYFLTISPVADIARGISGGIKAAPLSIVSTVLDVKLETPIPEKGEAILTKLFQVYNSEGIEDKNQIASRTLHFIENRLQLVINQLDSVEKNIVSYQSKESLFSAGSQAELYLSKVSDLDKRKGEIDLQLDLLKDIKIYTTNKGKKVGTVPSLNLVTDPILAGLLTQLYAAEFDRDRVINISGELSETTLQANEKVNRLRIDIQESLNNIRANLLIVKADIIAQTNVNNGLLNQVPQKERGLLEISRQQAVKNSIYSYLLQKREETALSSASTSSDLRVIENANSYGPVSPIPKNYYLTSFIIGLLTAIFVVLVKEQFKTKIMFRDEVSKKILIPFVGEIIEGDTRSSIAILDGKRTVIAEQFRALRTNLNFIGLNEQHNSLMVTSSINGEGKSFLALNLAISLTLTGKKVALMELDLRKPKLSKFLNIEIEPGLSNYLVGNNSYEEILKETSIKNLYIFPAGSIPPNPTELISQPNFFSLINKIKNDFDFVVIDTPPIGPVTDALILKNHADVCLYVIRHDRTPKVFIRLMNELYVSKKLTNMCLVFNGIKNRGINIGNLNNSFGYGYGYGYDYTIKDNKVVFPGIKNMFKKRSGSFSKS